jgi:hypothetical protein
MRAVTNHELMKQEYANIRAPQFRGRVWFTNPFGEDSHSCDIDGVVKFTQLFIYAYGSNCGDYPDNEYLIVRRVEDLLHFESNEGR